MSESHHLARAEAIREILRMAGHPQSWMAEHFIEDTDITPEMLRAIAGLRPLPTPRQKCVPHFAEVSQ